MGQKKLNPSAFSKEFSYDKKEREPKVIGCRMLIVCEGAKTEPNYFNEFNKTQQGSVVFDLEVDGAGTETKRIVEKAIKLRDAAESSQTPYDRVWAVFDRDSFPPNDFNGAIQMAQSNDICLAWSNEAFELWYLYHFHNRNTAMSRDEYKKAISDAVNAKLPRKGKTKYIYAKNAKDNHQIMTTYGDQDQAIKWAESQHKTFESQKYSEHNPCTLVYALVKQLLGRDDVLTKEVMRKINKK